MFDSDFRNAHLDNGNVVSFTNAESQVLSFLARHPNKILTREQILEGTQGDTVGSGDRNIDHLINRLRRKLGDNPKEPRFIGTRYGGGYFWLGSAAKPSEKVVHASAKIIVGPVRGIELLGGRGRFCRTFLNELAKATGKAINVPRSEIEILENFDARDFSNNDLPEKNLDVTFFVSDGVPEVVVSCRTLKTPGTPSVKRVSFQAESFMGIALTPLVERIVSHVIYDRWKSDVKHHCLHAPLALAMLEASMETKDTRVAWLENVPKIAKLKEEFPDDPSVKIMQACHIFLQHVSFGWDMAKQSGMDWHVDLLKIEKLVLSTLDDIVDEPDLMLMAAKLLHYSDPAYLSAALDISRSAQKEAIPVASSFAMLGQLEAFAGETERAISLLKQAEMLCDKGTRMHTFILTLLCQVLIATEQRDAIAPFKKSIIKNSPAARFLYEPVLTDPNNPSIFAKGVMLSLNKKSASAFLRFFHLISARLFANPQHGASVIHAPCALFVRRFGLESLPTEISVAYGDIL